ncbi:dTDP-4-dehydrorhamnose 3,5-epimerase [Neobacillus citreus]|uniref:dTDP-4-dehydrorhamnose 3,5-epimerase n=1 Tax=Neobacillus citreus TaxID=2833578 RepID=A0A942T3A8_9BACI|nr:dTDP-4-dehydrorhamnose 3,5-epimerase [Neobacillus citreus]MCH6268415.1 dTDP-4-dehydrorhamnose 3,5-epimerase [Neobacillus citreus]
MIFTETKLKGAYIIEVEPYYDERGSFVRTWCRQEFLNHDLDTQFVQTNLSFNNKIGIIRGMHFQAPPYEEIKLVSCIKGEIYDVIIDLRPDSKTFKQWTAVRLSEENQKMLYVPKGFAHGFQTLQENTKVLYQMSEFYQPNYAEGVRFNDPAFHIDWPIKDVIVSNKDQSYRDFKT